MNIQSPLSDGMFYKVQVKLQSRSTKLTSETHFVQIKDSFCFLAGSNHLNNRSLASSAITISTDMLLTYTQSIAVLLPTPRLITPSLILPHWNYPRLQENRQVITSPHELCCPESTNSVSPACYCDTGRLVTACYFPAAVTQAAQSQPVTFLLL